MDISVYFLSSSQELQTDVRQEFGDARLQAKAIHEAVLVQGEAAHQDINRVIQAVEQVRRLYSIDTLSTIDNGIDTHWLTGYANNFVMSIIY